MTDIDSVHHAVQYIDQLRKGHGHCQIQNIFCHAPLAEIIFLFHKLRTFLW